MQFGVCDIAVDPVEDFIELVRYIEGTGYDYLWVVDCVLHSRDTFAYLGAATQHSRRLRLGTNIVNPVSRHPAVNLVGITTIDDLTGGRAIFGVGLGSDYYLREIGERPSSRQLVADTVVQCRRLLAGETVTWRGERFALEEARLRYYTRRRAIPIYVAATGPKMLELAGEVGDGAFVHVGAHPKTVAFAQERIRDGARRAGRDPGAIDVSLFLFCSVGPDRRECLDDCRMASALIVSRVPDYARVMGYDPKLVDEIRQTWKRTSSAAAAGRLVPDAWVDDLNLVGSPEEVVRKLEALAALGIRHVTILPRGHSEGGRSRIETVRAVAEHVIPHFAREPR
jgi:5,10-methylenetetrahydromethanopterin reductase